METNCRDKRKGNRLLEEGKSETVKKKDCTFWWLEANNARWKIKDYGDGKKKIKIQEGDQQRQAEGKGKGE